MPTTRTTAAPMPIMTRGDGHVSPRLSMRRRLPEAKSTPILPAAERAAQPALEDAAHEAAAMWTTLVRASRVDEAESDHDRNAHHAGRPQEKLHEGSC